MISWWEKLDVDTMIFLKRFLVLQLVVRLKGYSNRVTFLDFGILDLFFLIRPLSGVLVNAGRSTTFLVARAGGRAAFFPQIQQIVATANEETPSWLPKLPGFGQWIRVGWPSLRRCLGGGPVRKTRGDLHGN